jgi:DNA-binding NarL/FixJ family response regulator
VTGPATDPESGSADEPAVVRLVVADDQELIRSGLVMILDAQPDLEVVGVAADGREAVGVVRRTAPDVVLMDVRMPVLDGVAATREIVAAQPTIRVLVLTTFDLDEYVLGALRAGASGFLLKDAPRASLLAAVRAVATGDVLLSPDVTRRLVTSYLMGGFHRSIEASRALAQMTPRELDVLRLVATRRSNSELAGELHLAQTTVKTHVARLLDKLGARDRVQLVVLAHRWGLGDPAR